MDNGRAVFGEFPKQEHVALIGVVGGTPFLAQANTEEFLAVLDGLGDAGAAALLAVLADVAELHVDPLVALEANGEVVHILLLGLLGVAHLAHGLHIGAARGDHLTRDDECVVAEHLLHKGEVLCVVGGAEAFHELEDLHLLLLRCRLAAVFHAFGSLRVDGEAEVGDFALEVKLHDGFLIHLRAGLLRVLNHQGNVIDLHAAVALEHPQALYHFAVIAVKLQVGPKHRERLNGKLVHRQVLGLQGAVGAASGIDFRKHDAEVLLCFRYAGGTAHARIGGQRNGDALRKEAHATGGKSQDEMYEFPFHIFE